MTRRLLVPALTALAALALAASAGAYWSAPGAGTGAGATGGLDQVTGVAPSVTGTVASGSFDVSWTPVGVPAAVVPTYVVERRAGATTTTVCTTIAAECVLTGIPDGSATYRVTARLNAWSGATSAASVAVKVLSTAPAISAGPPADMHLDKAELRFAESPYTSFRCRLDAAPATPCTSPLEYTNLALGPHTFEVRAIDAYGSQTQAATWAWVIDP
jgi:large repetitive protein